MGFSFFAGQLDPLDIWDRLGSCDGSGAHIHRNYCGSGSLRTLLTTRAYFAQLLLTVGAGRQLATHGRRADAECRRRPWATLDTRSGGNLARPMRTCPCRPDRRVQPILRAGLRQRGPDSQALGRPTFIFPVACPQQSADTLPARYFLPYYILGHIFSQQTYFYRDPGARWVLRYFAVLMSR
jgi:hypothetical protein